MRVFITGGSGELGSRLGRLLVERGHEVTAASRSARPTRDVSAVELDLATGAGLGAVEGHDTVVHLASDPFAAQRVDVDGTRRLIDASAAAGVGHLVAISIVGIDDHPYAYYRAKLEMERIVEDGPVPWTILRATQFHSLIPRFLEMLPAVGVVPVPTRVSLQPIDVDVVAERLADLVEAGPSGRVADLGGPEVIPLRTMVKDVLAARRLRRLVVPMPVSRGLGTAIRDGRMLTAPTQRGTRWADHVATIGPARDVVGKVSMVAALILLATAVWMAVSPDGFHATVATFGEPNDHLFRDLATFTLPLVIGLWIAADRRSWRVPVFAIVLIQNGAHAINHLVDITAADPVAIGVVTFIALAGVEVFLVWMLRRTLRPAPAPTSAVRPSGA